MTPSTFVLLCLSTFYLAFAFTRTSGPFMAFKRLRTRYPKVKVYNCLICAAPYAAVLCLLLYLSGISYILEVGAASGVATFMFLYNGGNFLDNDNV